MKIHVFPQQIVTIFAPLTLPTSVGSYITTVPAQAPTQTPKQTLAQPLATSKAKKTTNTLILVARTFWTLYDVAASTGGVLVMDFLHRRTTPFLFLLALDGFRE